MHRAVHSFDQCDLYLGDCIEVMQSLGESSIDCVLCDLPYGLTEYDWDVVIPLQPLWEQYSRVVKPDGKIILFGSQQFTHDLIASNRDRLLYPTLVWSKPNCNFMTIHEDILVFANTYRESKRINFALPNTVLRFHRVPHPRLHEAQKPIELIEHLLGMFTKEGDVVLDNACGSGTTLIAARKLRRSCIGIEKEEKFYKISLNRMVSFGNQNQFGRAPQA